MKYRARNVSGCIDITSEFDRNMETTSNSSYTYVYLTQNGERGGYYSNPLYVVPQGTNAKIMGMRLNVYGKITATKISDSSSYSPPIVDAGSKARLKINTTNTTPYGGLPNVSTVYTVTADDYLYLNEVDRIMLVMPNDTNFCNINTAYGSPATLDYLKVDIYMSIIEEVED